MKLHCFSTMFNLLGKCGTMEDLKKIHAVMITSGLIKNIILLSKLIDFCVDYNPVNMDYAYLIFLKIDRPSAYIWNSMIRGLTRSSEYNEALSMYREMCKLSYSPDNFTFPFVLKACGKIRDSHYGDSIHNRILKTGFEWDLYVCTGMMQMYIDCGDMQSAEKLFQKMPDRNVVTWTTLISGYVKNSRSEDAMKMFREMRYEGIEPNEITMVNMLVVCAQSRDIESGKLVHSYLHTLGFDPFQTSHSNSNFILATTILDMYARCGRLKIARNLFDEMPNRNEVSWNVMIGAYNQYGRVDEVLRLFVEMLNEGVKPDGVTMLSLLGACAHSCLWVLGRAIHGYIEKTSMGKDLAIETSLMDMYSKTGDGESSVQIFNGLYTRDVKAWTSMIIGLAMHGHGEEALNYFEKMEREGTIPDYITYIGVLCACSHGGLIDLGHKFFNSMRIVYGIEPTVEHYGCMVDMLSRSGKMVEAERLVQSMPIKPNINIWGALLSGCEIHGCINVAERVKNMVLELKTHGGIYVLLSNIYAKSCKWGGVKTTREIMRHKSIKKNYGYSFIEVYDGPSSRRNNQIIALAREDESRVWAFS